MRSAAAEQQNNSYQDQERADAADSTRRQERRRTMGAQERNGARGGRRGKKQRAYRRPEHRAAKTYKASEGEEEHGAPSAESMRPKQERALPGGAGARTDVRGKPRPGIDGQPEA
jgi:hypothetical protein